MPWASLLPLSTTLMDRVVKVTDAKGNATTYTYDAVGNVSTETNAKGVTTSYVYDANYNLTSLTDAAGTSTYLYDAMDRWWARQTAGAIHSGSATTPLAGSLQCGTRTAT